MNCIDRNNINRADLNLLVVFSAIYKERNITKAGKRLNLAQPSVSSALTRLRTQFNDRLFLRRGSFMEPTPRARELIVPIEKCLNIAQQIFSSDVEFDPENPGDRTFSIALSDYSTLVLAPELMTRIREKFPKIVIEFHPLRRGELGLLFDRNEIDLAIGSHLSVAPNIVSETLFEEHFVCVRSAKRSNGKKLSLEEYVEMDHLLFTASNDKMVPDMIDDALQKQNLSRNIVAFTPFISSIPFIIEHTDLIATISSRLANKYREFLSLCIDDFPLETLEPFSIDVAHVDSEYVDNGREWLKGEIAKLM